MRMISNASPLINLSRIGELDLLKKLYGEIIIPDAVWNEIAIEGTGQPGSEEVRNASWI
jgi:predicted nucleic acid-binding protein